SRPCTPEGRTNVNCGQEEEAMVVKPVGEDDRKGVTEVFFIVTAGTVLCFRRSCSLISSAANRSSFSPLVRSDTFLSRNSTDSNPLSVNIPSPSAAAVVVPGTAP
ncbi:hypothetical protein BHM03_00059516, partial [Ensete ventricosum]